MSKAKRYIQKYRKEWENDPSLKLWVTPDSLSDKKAFCKYCKLSITARIKDLQRHANSERHKTTSAPYGPKQSKLNFLSQKELYFKNECQARLSLFVAVHTSIRSIDHLSNICNSCFKDSSFAGFRMHRTKCSGIITNIIGNEFERTLIDDICNSNSYYSLLIDESTDITVKKMLGLIVRYYSEQQNCLISTFLSLIEIESGKAEDVVKAIVNYLNSAKINLNYLCGLGSDNASVMTGSINGVYAILKRDYNLPNLVLVRCVCHTLQLALSDATKSTLPRNLEFLVKETHNWFANSTDRQNKYCNLYKTINIDDSPLKIPKMCATRWISIEPAVRRILEQCVELKTHFEITRLSENCYTADLLFKMYKDDLTYIFLLYLHPVVEEVQKTNKLFESDKVDPTKLFESLKVLITNLCLPLIIPSAKNNFDFMNDDLRDKLDPKPYLGFKFESACSDFLIKNPDSFDAVKNLKERCVQFTLKLIAELRRRLPSNLELLNSCSLLSVSEALRHPSQKKSITVLAQQFLSDPFLIQRIERQWDNLNFVNWSSVETTESFWAEINLSKDAGGNDKFKDILKLAKLVFCLPHSNSAIERVFNHMNFFKNKIRNSLCLKTVNALLHIKFGLLNSGCCCDTYKISENILTKIGTLATYNENEACDEALAFVINDVDLE